VRRDKNVARLYSRELVEERDVEEVRRPLARLSQAPNVGPVDTGAGASVRAQFAD
jgi:hypothetical protein